MTNSTGASAPACVTALGSAMGAFPCAGAVADVLELFGFISGTIANYYSLNCLTNQHQAVLSSKKGEIVASKPIPVCDFCSRKQYEVDRIFVGPSVHICSVCVESARLLCEKEEKCSFCNAEPAGKNWIVFKNPVSGSNICMGCVVIFKDGMQRSIPFLSRP